MKRRVVITGLGTINPIGNNTKETLESIYEGKCGIDKITYFDTENFKTKLAAEVKDYDSLKYFDAVKEYNNKLLEVYKVLFDENE